MAGAIASTGVGSGLDVNSIVTSLMAVEKQPLQQLQARATTIKSQISAYGSLSSQLSSLADLATRLGDSSAWSPMTADSSDTASVTATATSSASAGQHTISVSQLAQAQVLATGSYASSQSAVGTGRITIEVGSTSPGGVFTAKTGTQPVAIDITSANQSLAGIRDAINAAKAGVTASIVTGSGGARLVLRAADGVQNTLKISVSDGDGVDTDASGLSALAWDPAAAAGSGRNLSQTQVAKDAMFSIDGVDLTSATNTTADALEGVSLTLRKVTAQPVSLQLSVQTDSVKKNITDFVAGYNALNTLLKQQTQVDPGGKNSGPLQSDATAVGLLNQLRSLLHVTVSGLGSPNTLSAAGIALQRDGSLKVDDAKLAPWLASPSKLAALFTQAPSGTDTSSSGIALRFKTWAQGLTGDTGAIGTRKDSLQGAITRNQDQQDDVQRRLDATELRLRAQYQQLDSQMSALNARMAQMKSALGLT